MARQHRPAHARGPAGGRPRRGDRRPPPLPRGAQRFTPAVARIGALEREEIARCVAQPGVTMRAAAAQLGLSRATLYRKMAQYDLHVPR
ncbi:MAG: helix-turn-helix domain-containing protein [Pedococcus sp.]